MAIVILLPAGSVEAQNTPEGDTLTVYTLDPIVVSGRVDDLTCLTSTASTGFVGHQDLRLRPLVREGELLETVPGMILAQHSGDGKANQFFVRGFNLENGTDLNSVNGIVFKDNGKIINTKPRAYVEDLDTLDFPLTHAPNVLDSPKSNPGARSLADRVSRLSYLLLPIPIAQ